ncbi:hypothetical protein V6N13_084443 [Hibiscus sabdariffa]
MGRLHGRSGVGFISPPDGVLSRLDSERTERLVEESFADLDSSRGRETGLVFDPGANMTVDFMSKLDSSSSIAIYDSVLLTPRLRDLLHCDSFDPLMYT